MHDNLTCTIYFNGKRTHITLEPLPSGDTIISMSPVSITHSFAGSEKINVKLA